MKKLFEHLTRDRTDEQCYRNNFGRCSSHWSGPDWSEPSKEHRQVKRSQLPEKTRSRIMNILVIGCGVSGLTTGLCLLDAGHTVSIWAKELPPHTTSNVAAAAWYPYKAYPADRVTRWGKKALQKFKELQADKDSGVFMTNVLEVKP